MAVIYDSRRRVVGLDRIEKELKHQYAQYFTMDKHIGNEELIPDERGKAFKEYKGDRVRGRVDNSKPLKGWSRFQRVRRTHKEEGMSDVHRDYIPYQERKVEG